LGFGRGKFLYPFLEEFGNYNITALEQNEKAIEEASTLQKSYNKMVLVNDNFFNNNYLDKTFHTITALEIMEHIEDTELFIDECVRLAYEWLILSVPSKEDDNPQHIHFFTEDKVNKLFIKYNLTPKYEYVLNHMIIKVKL
jgi:2-polyprenyl-3-methyl-5-hydroxy-6-metoxy-1,4-benzoquinol methylase